MCRSPPAFSAPDLTTSQNLSAAPPCVTTAKVKFELLPVLPFTLLFAGALLSTLLLSEQATSSNAAAAAPARSRALGTIEFPPHRRCQCPPRPTGYCAVGKFSAA